MLRTVVVLFAQDKDRSPSTPKGPLACAEGHGLAAGVLRRSRFATRSSVAFCASSVVIGVSARGGGISYTFG